MLHARGDVSDAFAASPAITLYAPRTWRCFHSPVRGHYRGQVCSTHVEMFLMFMMLGFPLSSYAPRTWRCFLLFGYDVHDDLVCSTHVEMFPLRVNYLPRKVRMLHARGDVSRSSCLRRPKEVYAPRTWRCFRYATPPE